MCKGLVIWEVFAEGARHHWAGQHAAAGLAQYPLSSHGMSLGFRDEGCLQGEPSTLGAIL